jgi:hypothetical protein
MNARYVPAVLAGLAMLCLVAMGTFAHAQERPCAPHDDIVEMLVGKYQEGKRAMGLINQKAMMEAYVSDKGTWTFLITDTRGMTCVLAAGDSWEYVTEAFKKGQGT